MPTIEKRILAPSETYVTFDGSAEDTEFHFVLPTVETYNSYFERRLPPNIIIQSTGDLGNDSKVVMLPAEGSDDLLNGETEVEIEGDFVTIVNTTIKTSTNTWGVVAIKKP